MTDDELESYEERAAIMQHDGGLSKEDAELAAMNCEALKDSCGSNYVVVAECVVQQRVGDVLNALNKASE